MRHSPDGETEDAADLKSATLARVWGFESLSGHRSDGWMTRSPAAVRPNIPPMKDILAHRSRIADFVARRSALIALAVFAIAGVAVLDDYGVYIDERLVRYVGYASFDYILGDEGALLAEDDSDRFYGVAFEIALIAAERALGLEDSRSIYLSRHLLGHALFLAGGFFCWLLAYRIFRNRAIALIAMSLFLLHPRIYAHSFFNTKDPPFASAFIVSLYLIHRAFRRDGVWAFALCGAGVGALMNIRNIGVMLLAAVLGMLALDLLRALRGGGGAGRVLANGAAFALAAALTLYAAYPALWSDPLELAEGLGVMARHPEIVASLFRGEYVVWPNVPWDFIPVWMLITTPPVALVLALAGAGRAVYLIAARWRGATANSPERFWALVAACLILPIAAVIALNSNLYSDWRQMHFLYVPVCLLAALGLRSAVSLIPKREWRFGVYAATVAALLVVIFQMARLHPYQNEYFNILVNRAEPGALGERYEMDYGGVSRREAAEFLLEAYPNRRIAADAVGPWLPYIYMDYNLLVIPPAERERIVRNTSFPDFVIHGTAVDDPFWSREIYGVPIVSIADNRAASESAHRAARESAMSSEPVAESGFDVYLDGKTLTYIKEPCSDEDARGRFQLWAFPARESDLWRRSASAGLRYNQLNFGFLQYGKALDGVCVIKRTLPDYPLTHVEIGQWIPGEGGLWRTQINFSAGVERYMRAADALAGETPSIRSDYDVYLEGRTLTYVKSPCESDDTRGRFFLSVFPTAPADLSEESRAAGRDHDAMNFDFHQYGVIAEGRCVIIRTLPDYPTRRVETGQWIPGESGLWEGDIEIGE